MTPRVNFDSASGLALHPAGRDALLADHLRRDRRLPAVEEDGCVRHLHFDRPLTVVMNGRSSRGMILKPDVSRSLPVE